MARILVTGGAGFLGSHLCDTLLAAGHDLRPSDDQHAGAAKRTKARILQASTSEVYGDPKVHPQTEYYRSRVNPLGPRSCYNEGKRCAETLFFDYRRQHAVDIKVARIFNTYGPRMKANDGRVVSDFIVRALRGEDIVIHGDGQQTRSFCYVDDLIRRQAGLMNATPEVTGPINLGNPVETSILELAELIPRLTRSQSKLLLAPRREDDPVRRCPDITRARQILAWSPTVALEDGIKETLADFRCRLEQ